jgi:hypothetical protein
MKGEREVPLQQDMFTHELVDNRTAAQKRKDRERRKARPLEMFSARQVAQFGVNPRPLIEISPTTKLTLVQEDPRTEEEIERDRRRAAEEQTGRMFSGHPDLYENNIRQSDSAPDS